ncbi:MAG: hypothetical protein N2Z62_00990 [Rhodobacteraceae bacterium]|nr:hypothetical protein [Paracoccaceae bacterium]
MKTTSLALAAAIGLTAGTAAPAFAQSDDSLIRSLLLLLNDPARAGQVARGWDDDDDDGWRPRRGTVAHDDDDDGYRGGRRGSDDDDD